MSTWREQEMATLDLVENSEPTRCLICDSHNRFDAEWCSHCGAPVALAFSRHVQASSPRHLIAVLGTPAAGKTVYLGMLTDILSRQQGRLQALARGAFSVSLQQRAMAALARRRFPDRTGEAPDHWNWVHCEVSGLPKRRRVELILPDLSGSAYLSNPRESELPAIRGFLAKCSAALVLVDTERIERGDPQEDFQAMKILARLGSLAGPEARRNGRPVAVVFTKSDCSAACSADPADYAAKCAPGLFRHCRERVHQHRFFAASVVGSCATVIWRGERICLPLRIEPRGVVEPFEWLVEQI